MWCLLRAGVNKGETAAGEKVFVKELGGMNGCKRCSLGDEANEHGGKWCWRRVLWVRSCCDLTVVTNIHRSRSGNGTC